MTSRVTVLTRIGAIAVLLLYGSKTAMAQQVLSPAGPIVIASAVAGAQPTSVVAAAPGYSGVVPFVGQKKIVGQLNTATPAGVTLAVRITGSSGGTSLGYVALGIAAKDIVIATTPAFYSTVNISYTLSATVTAGVVPATSRTVTFTLLDYP
ncbi:MAG TPA: hypothetical protein VGP25_06795 [Gemmatimonadaceae bacterium]|jgi:hypothetical protein|nr:hypothetical protein [Gemmatimonadaceae bacterium]